MQNAKFVDVAHIRLDNRQGIATRPTIIGTTGDFAHAILDTMQNWSDSMQAHVPGYRDRIVAVEHTKDEGGLNLDMDRCTILRLAARGHSKGDCHDDDPE